MDDWQHEANRKIEEALENGELDSAASHGKRLDLTENPFVPEGQRLAYKMLADNGFAPAWIEDNKEVREAIGEALTSLERARKRFEAVQKQYERHTDAESIYAREAAYGDWDDACRRFRNTAARINKLIMDYNLKAPISSLHRARFDPEREIARVEASAEPMNGDSDG